MVTFPWSFGFLFPVVKGATAFRMPLILGRTYLPPLRGSSHHLPYLKSSLGLSGLHGFPVVRGNTAVIQFLGDYFPFKVNRIQGNGVKKA